MSLNIIEGIPGSGKSYIGVNWFIKDFLITTNRKIYTNLPLNLEALIGYLLTHHFRKTARSPAAREEFARAIRDRIRFLSWDLKQPYVLDENGDVVTMTIKADESRCLEACEFTATEEQLNSICLHKKIKRGERYIQPGETVTFPLVVHEDGQPLKPMIECRNFWYFVGPNSIVILDEVADIFNARNFKELAGTKLQSYINHHRHYKDDLYIFCQSHDDLDKQLRTKVATLYMLSNSTKENMFESSWMMGIKWPVQFFFVRTYLRMGKTFVHQDTYRVLPNKDGFKNYNSFSKPDSISGKALPTEESKNEDLPSWRQALRGFWRRSSSLVLFSCGCLGGVLGFYLVISYMLEMSRSDSVAAALGHDAKKPGKDNKTASDKKPISPVKNDTEKHNKEPGKPPGMAKPVERVLLVTPSGVRTNLGSYTFDDCPPDLLPVVRATLARQRSSLAARLRPPA